MDCVCVCVCAYAERNILLLPIMNNEQLQQKQMNEKNEKENKRKKEIHNKIRAKRKESSKHYSHSLPAIGCWVLDVWCWYNGTWRFHLDSIHFPVAFVSTNRLYRAKNILFSFRYCTLNEYSEWANGMFICFAFVDAIDADSPIECFTSYFNFHVEVVVLLVSSIILSFYYRMRYASNAMWTKMHRHIHP